MASRVKTSGDRTTQEAWRSGVDAACVALQASPYPDSLSAHRDWALALVRRGRDKYLLLLSRSQALLGDFSGRPPGVSLPQESIGALLCPLTADNARAVRKHVPLLAPAVLGRGLSVGMGDRLGMATPGHVRAIRGQAVQPVLAQQSIREMSRTRRSPRDVLDDVTWGVLQAGYQDGYAADADHLKTAEDLAVSLEAGFTMFTIDPGDLIDDGATRSEIGDLAAGIAALPWSVLECTADECRRRYADRTVLANGRRGELRLELKPRDVLRSAVKYGRAIAHTAMLYRQLVSRCPRERFAFEVAVDETDTPTSPAEHYYLASELRRLGVQCDSLAPRFVGRFLKGVDYVGDPARFRAEFAKHVLIAEHFGGYKLSLHSGSDKFTIYPTIAELAGDALHIKTSGTSYLEALRVVADADPDLFREIVTFAKQRYAEDAEDYHVGADLAKVADPDQLRDDDLPDMLNQSDPRQLCHVTYGSVLTSTRDDGRPRFRDRLFRVLQDRESVYHRRLEDHFRQHISAFV
jgi:hypothetical protein